MPLKSSDTMPDEMSESILEIALDRTPDEMSDKNADKMSEYRSIKMSNITNY